MESAAAGAVSDVSSAIVASAAPTRRLINVWLVDNQPLFQEAVANALRQTADLALAGYFVHPEDALLYHKSDAPPDVILMDAQQFGCVGIEAVRQFRTLFPGVPSIILTESIDEEVISAAVCAGASAYLLKTSPLEKISESIREVIAGGALLAPVVTRSLLEMFRRLSGARRDCGLTVRELRILDLMGRGLVMKEIAEQLAISYHTVDSHSRNIYAKLGVRSRTGAVAKALRERII